MLILAQYMEKMLIDRNDLIKLRNDIDNLIKDEKSNISKQAAVRSIYEHHDLTQKEKLIIKHIRNNPGQTKEDVVRNLGKYSRVPIFNSINKLVRDGLILIEEDEVNSRIHHLYVNNQNILISLIGDLDYFKAAYFNLIQKAKPILKALFRSRDSELYCKAWDLLIALMEPYKCLIVMYSVSDLVLWRTRPLDNETLLRKFAIIFTNMQEIFPKLYEIMPNKQFKPDRELLRKILFDVSIGFNPGTIITMLTTFEEHGLSYAAEPVIDLLWKMSYPIRPLLNSPYNTDKEDVLIDDWRKVMSGQYTPKQNNPTDR
jgi:DNA-binding MarR family transcriptional regulator